MTPSAGPGTLHIVATPIGNLEDVTLRALRVLREVALIAAEDTRRTGKLLTHFGLTTPTLSYHAHNVRLRQPHLLGRLQAGEHVALVTDAGTPGISDPGAELVDACVRAGIPVDPVPGVSAPLTAAVASGFSLNPFTILGFAPARSAARRTWLKEVSGIRHTFSFFEAPHRIAETLADAGSMLGNRPIVVGRELTKAHEEFLRGSPSDVSRQLKTLKGEFTVVVGPAPDTESVPMAASDEQVAADFGLITEFKVGGRRQAVKELAKRLGRPTREIYAAVERSKQSGKRPKSANLDD